MIMATKGGFLGQLQRIAECRLRKVGSNMVSQLNLQKHYISIYLIYPLVNMQVNIIVSDHNALSLSELESKYKVLVSQLVRQYSYCWANITLFLPVLSVSNRSRVVLYS